MPERTASSPQPPAGERIAALDRLGAARNDPVRFRFIAALARRTQEHRGAGRHLLEARLEKALDECAARCAEARQAAGETLARAAARHPDAAATLESLYAAGDFAGLRRIAAALDAGGRTPLADLVAYVAERSAPAPGMNGAPDSRADAVPAASLAKPAAPTDSANATGSARELKSLRYFRSTWSALSVDRQLAQALAQGPENAGPLNSHRLVLRSLQLMRDVAPNYLQRFMSYADALLWLERAEASGAPAKKTPPPAKARGGNAPAADAENRRGERPAPAKR